jgi:hypothetical protein
MAYDIAEYQRELDEMMTANGVMPEDHEVHDRLEEGDYPY